VQIHQGDSAALSHFMEYLRRKGVIPTIEMPPRHLTPVELSVQAFEHYLRSERILANVTIAHYLPFVDGFLTERFSDGPVTLSHLSAADVIRFVQRQAPRLHVKRAKLLTTALRSFLRFAQYRGDIASDLASAVPTVASWSMTSIPRAIPADAVRQLLASINQCTPMGLRNYAILLLLARLGLRAGEVVRLELEDINWNGGYVNVKGKGGQRSALPLPTDVGTAIAAYLQHGRQQSSCRRVFLRARAPIRGFLDQTAVGSLVRNSLAHAGIKAPTKGAHQFRHALATEMLSHGASLTEIGEILRHRSPQTTTIYTKVDIEALRTLSLPWPGGV
jgi:site-specific recombinase XerD